MMRGFLFHAHSGLRYLVLVLALAAAAGLARAAFQGRAAPRPVRILTSAYVGLLDLQVLLGLLLLLQVPFYGQLAGHIVLMFAAALVAHAGAMIDKKRAEAERSAMPLLIGVAVSLVLTVLEILAIGRPVLGSLGG